MNKVQRDPNLSTSKGIEEGLRQSNIENSSRKKAGSQQMYKQNAWETHILRERERERIMDSSREGLKEVS